MGCGVPPYALEGLPGGSDRNIDILLGALVDGADDLLSRRVDNLELLLVGALDPFVVDEPGERVKCELRVEARGATGPIWV